MSGELTSTALVQHAEPGVHECFNGESLATAACMHHANEGHDAF